MGERKGVNKYYPPDYDPSKGGLNKFRGTHALRERARKLHMGILIIRFEMPYNIWCDGCENHIGTGVRYNAEKKKVGMYYSTPIYQFRMKCHLCDNHFEIKTDPANLDYEIVTGARRQERRWDPTTNEQVVPEDKEVTRKMASDAMFKLEHGVGDKEKSKVMEATIQQLEDFQTSRWQDDYGSNKTLRESMRVKRMTEQEQSARDASYRLSVPLLPPDEKDEKTAKLLQFTQSKSCDQLLREKREAIDAQSVFARLKTKSVSPLAKKAFARQSLEGIISHSQKNLLNVKSSIKPQNLGIVPKKIDSEGNVSELKIPTEDLCKCGKKIAPTDISSSVKTNASLSINCNYCISNSKGTSPKVIHNKEHCTVASTSVDKTEIKHTPAHEESVNISQEKGKVLSLVGYDYSGSDSD